MFALFWSRVRVVCASARRLLDYWRPTRGGGRSPPEGGGWFSANHRLLFLSPIEMSHSACSYDGLDSFRFWFFNLLSPDVFVIVAGFCYGSGLPTSPQGLSLLIVAPFTGPLSKKWLPSADMCRHGPMNILKWIF